MDRYKILRKGILQSLSAFEEQVNSMQAEVWKVLNMTADQGRLYVMLERDR